MNDFPQELTSVEKYKPFLNLQIVDDITAGQATDIRQEAKDHLKKIEETRSHLKEPVLEMGRRIDAQAKKASEPLNNLIKYLDQNLLAWNEAQEEKRRQEEEKKRAEEIARLESEASSQAAIAEVFEDPKAVETLDQIQKNIERLEVKPIEVSSTIRTGQSTSFVQKRWKFAVVDETLVPREFMMIDMVKLGRYATAMKDKAKVLGVKFFEEASIGGRR